MSEKFVGKAVDDKGDGLNVSSVVQVGSGGTSWLPRHLDWIKWSLR